MHPIELMQKDIRHANPEWSMMNGSGDFKSGIIHENFWFESGSVRFLTVSKTVFESKLLLGNSANEGPWFIDSLVLLSKLTQGSIKILM